MTKIKPQSQNKETLNLRRQLWLSFSSGFIQKTKSIPMLHSKSRQTFKKITSMIFKSMIFFPYLLHFYILLCVVSRAQAPLLGGAVLPVLGQLLHLHLQTLDLVSKVLLEEPVGLQGRVPLSLRLFASAFESRREGSREGGVWCNTKVSTQKKKKLNKQTEHT